MGKSAPSSRTRRTTTRKKTSTSGRSKRPATTSKTRKTTSAAKKAATRKATPSKKVEASPASKIKVTSYSTAVRYLYERVDFERMRVVRFDASGPGFKLDRMKALLSKLGDPHEQVKMVHVGGTVGKGSTVAMVSSMLKGCDYAVGTYTSPHLMDVRERIAINGRKISKPDFTDVIKQVASAARRSDVEPTFFELMTAAAFKYFADQAVDIAVIEVGLGGRLDSTNVITPLVTLLTTIDYDHTQILGSSLQSIATEKAGIFKRGVPVLSFEQHDAVEEVLRERAAKVGAPLKIINKDIEYSSRFGATAELGPHTRICLLTGSEARGHNVDLGTRNSEARGYMHIPVPLPGEHQAGNCALALAAIEALREAGFNFPEAALHGGLSQTYVPGRMELVQHEPGQPRVLVDGAHNPAAVSALMRCAGVHVPYDSMVCIFGCCEDKNIPKMLDSVALGADKVIFTRAKGNARAADPVDLQREFQERSGKMNQVAKSLPEALDLARRAVGRDDLICITGSFYLVGEAKKHFEELDRRRAS